LQGRSQRGDMGECPPRHGLKKFFSPWITDRWLLCNWCHTPNVAKTKGKCAISTLIFRKFSRGYAPRHPYWEGATAPLSRLHPLRALLGTFGPSIVVSPLTKILATRLPSCHLTNTGFIANWKDKIQGLSRAWNFFPKFKDFQGPYEPCQQNQSNTGCLKRC